MSGGISIPWASGAARERVRRMQEGSEPGTPEDLARAHRAVLRHIRRMDGEGLVLYAGSNAVDPPAHDPEVGMRPSLGDPGEKLQPGLEDLEVLEVLTTRAVAATMCARHADARVPSATIANLAATTPAASAHSASPPPSCSSTEPSLRACTSQQCRSEARTVRWRRCGSEPRSSCGAASALPTCRPSPR